MAAAEPFRTVWPGGAPSVEVNSPAERPDSLAGRRIAFVWDNLFRGNEIFAILEDALSGIYPGATFVGYENFGSTMGADDHQVLADLPRKLAEHDVDLAISGVGCCGACTPAVVRASAVMEKAGIPTASLVCKGFTGGIPKGEPWRSMRRLPTPAATTVERRKSTSSPSHPATPRLPNQGYVRAKISEYAKYARIDVRTLPQTPISSGPDRAIDYGRFKTILRRLISPFPSVNLYRSIISRVI